MAPIGASANPGLDEAMEPRRNGGAPRETDSAGRYCSTVRHPNGHARLPPPPEKENGGHKMTPTEEDGQVPPAGV